LVASNDAINHLHGSLVEEGRPGSVATETAIQQLVPSFVAETNGEQSGDTGQSCDFAGGTVPDGGNVVAYQSESVEAGGICSSQTRLCNNGKLSGSYTYTNCQVEEATDCQFNGNSIANGVSTTAYPTATVPFGSTCTSQTRTCSNGTLSGSYTFSNCNEADPLDCSFNGLTVEHGDFVTAYLSETVPAGGSCSSQTRTCFNEVLSGSYKFKDCEVSEALSCTFNGQILGEGQAVNAYQSESVAFGSTCTSQTRICSNGTLSGSYVYSDCVVDSGNISLDIDYAQPGKLYSTWKKFPSEDYDFLEYRVFCQVHYNWDHYMSVQVRNNSSTDSANTCAGITPTSEYFINSCGSFLIEPKLFQSYIGNFYTSYQNSGITGLQKCKDYSARIRAWDSEIYSHGNAQSVFSFDITSNTDPVDQLD